MRFWIEEEDRPGEKAALPKIQQAGESDSSVPDSDGARCRRCGRRLRSEKAVKRGYGWRCAGRSGMAGSR